MKSTKKATKLALSKTTIRHLREIELNVVHGGLTNHSACRLCQNELPSFEGQSC